MSSAQKVVSNTFYQLLAKSVSISSTVLTTALITRSLGIASFGAFFLMTGFATYFYLLIDFGINTVATKEITNNKELMKHYFGNILTLRIVYSLILVFLIALILPFIPFRFESLPQLRLGVFIGLLALISQGIYNSCTIVFQSSLSYQKTFVGALVGNLFFLLLSLIIIFNFPQLLLLVTANTLGTFVVSVYALYFAVKISGGVSLNFDLNLWKRLFFSAFPLGLTIFLTVIISKADSFLLSVIKLSESLQMTNAEALGNYGLAYKVFENALVLPTYFVNALFPVMVAHRKESFERLNKTLARSLWAVLGASLLVVILGFWLSPAVIFILSGSASSPSVLVLRVLILSLPLFFCSSVLMFYLVTAGKERYLPRIYLIAALLNIILNVVFIPRFGIIASAVITGLTELLIVIFLFYLSFVWVGKEEGGNEEV